MQHSDKISVNEFCSYHQVEVSFIHTLHEFSLISIITIDQDLFIPTEQLPVLEKIVRLHNDLEINIEGIDAITHLLNQMENMKEELTFIKNRLRIYEEND